MGSLRFETLNETSTGCLESFVINVLYNSGRVFSPGLSVCMEASRTYRSVYSVSLKLVSCTN